MALNPTYNYNFFGVDYAPTVFIGEAPKLMQAQLPVWATAWTTANPTVSAWQNGALIAQVTATGAYTLFDATNAATAPLKGIYFDETANPATVGTTGVFSNYAVRDGMETAWIYDKLIGAQGSTTDIDWLITNGHCTKRIDNGLTLVSFGVIGFGA